VLKQVDKFIYPVDFYCLGYTTYWSM
jgi:hypothetical protein